jgi:hypothetical protein
MPTTITSAGITFNDATTLTSANIGTAQLVNGSVTAAKLGTTEQRQIAKAWVNFNGAGISSASLASGQVITANAGGKTGTWTTPASWVASQLGTIFKIDTIGGSSSGTLGGIPCSQLFLQLTSIPTTSNAIFTLVDAGGGSVDTTFTSTQSITGTGSSSVLTFTSSGIRSSYNVSSVTKNGTSDYTINFTTALADANYSVSGSSINPSGIITLCISPLSSPTASSVRIETLRTSPLGGVDSTNVSVQIFGN